MKWVLAATLFVLASCAQHQEAPTTQPGEQALNDPFNYSPRMQNSDVSGGKINEFDKDSFKRDLDHVFNP